jgi:pimeloyl-ACP methyl ester carboxylesterase
MDLTHDDGGGTGTPLVLLHAFPLSRAMWRAQRAGLAGAGCRLVTPDLPGFGDSPLPADTPTVESMADDVAALLDRLGLRRVVLGGLSMGGYVAFAFVRKYADRLRGLILCDTKAEPDDEAAKANRDKLISFAQANPPAAVVEQMLPKLLGKETHDVRPHVAQEVRRIAAAQRPEGIVAALRMLRDRPDSRPTLETVRVPTLIVVGREDVLTPVSASEAMAARIAGSRLVVIEGAGHLSSLERPEAFDAAVKELVASLPAAG